MDPGEGTQWDEGKLDVGECCCLYSSKNNDRALKSNRMRRDGCGESGSCAQNLNLRKILWRETTDIRRLEWIFKQTTLGVRSRLTWPRTVCAGGLFRTQ